MVGSLMLRIVHVLHSLDIGGTENGVVNVVNALRDEFRHSVVSMTAAGPLASRLPPETVIHCLNKQPGLDLRGVARLTALLRRLRPDVVHSRNWGAFDAVLAARLARVPVVIHGEHGREIGDPEGRNRRRNQIRRLSAALVTRFVTVSHDLSRWLVEHVGVAPHKVLTIHNGVNVERFSPNTRDEARRILSVSPHTVVVGTVGRLDPVKDHAGLLQAVAMVANDHADVVGVIVGDGPSRGMLEDRTRVLGIDARTRLLGKRLDIPFLLSGFDIFVLPSIAEGLSNTILEAMAAGLPVVATRVGGNPEMVDDGVTGALIAPRQPQRLAQALTAYVGDPDLRARHGKAGRQRATDKFSLERMVDAYRNLYVSSTAKSFAVTEGIGREERLNLKAGGAIRERMARDRSD